MDVPSVRLSLPAEHSFALILQKWAERKQSRRQKKQGDIFIKMSRRHSTSMTAVAWLLINDSQDPILANCVFSVVVWYSATNQNNGPSVSRLHWNSFLSPSFHQHKNLLGETGYFRSTQKMKENEGYWIQMGARNAWTSSMSLYQHIYKNNNNNKKKWI